MANSPTSSTKQKYHSEIDFNVELGLFPIMVPSLFLPKVEESLPNRKNKLPGDLKEKKDASGLKGTKILSLGDDSEEVVYRVLENYERDKYMVVFHGTKINENTITEIRKLLKKFSKSYDFSPGIEKDPVTTRSHFDSGEKVAISLDVQLRKDPIETESVPREFGFAVYSHRRFVAVISEVKCLQNIEYGYVQLQESASLMKSVLKSDTRVIKKFSVVHF